jgi:hypothetical protein
MRVLATIDSGQTDHRQQAGLEDDPLEGISLTGETFSVQSKQMLSAAMRLRTDLIAAHVHNRQKRRSHD